MKSFSSRRHSRGFTLPEILITGSIATTVIGLTLGTFLMGLRTVTKDAKRLHTNGSLRHLTGHVARHTLGATGFYLFPSFASLDGNVDIVNDLSPNDDPGGGFLFHGDCLVLETKTDTSANSRIRQIRIYYRAPGLGQANNPGPIRYIEGRDYGPGGAPAGTTVTTLLNTYNLAANANPASAKTLVESALGNPRTASPFGNYPIFSTVDNVAPGASAQNLSINAVLVSEGVANASSLNYTISPRGQK
jgi:hypothetical protein